jgi:hypothetical protein
MIIEKTKDEERVAAAEPHEDPRGREGSGSVGVDDPDPREEEGWSQPEASTQKGAARQPEDGGGE